MSSTYRFLCLAHDPVIEVGGRAETQSLNEAVGLAERRATAPELVEHRGCRLLVGRFSAALVEVYDPKTRHWLDIDTFHLLVAGRAAGVTEAILEPFTRRGWDADTITRLRPYLEGS